MAAPRIAVPETATKGEVIEIRTLISHPMENGFNFDLSGKLIPRHIIHTFFVTYNETEIFRARLHPAQASNPYFTFYTIAEESGVLEFTWLDDKGNIFQGARSITVA